MAVYGGPKAALIGGYPLVTVIENEFKELCHRNNFAIAILGL